MTGEYHCTMNAIVLPRLYYELAMVAILTNKSGLEAIVSVTVE